MVVDSNCPCVLWSVANEIEAAGIVTALAEYDIEATATGGFASALTIGSPSDVQIVVRRSDLDRAKVVLSGIWRDQGKVDWATIDVGKPED